MRRLSLRNFQIHRKLDLVLGPVTSILGSSTNGKSSIIRALYWVAFNRPNGKRQITHGEKSCAVRIDDVSRHRGKENYYKVGDYKLGAVGSAVPGEVVEELRLSEVNFQMQHDPPFWLSLSSGLLAKAINSLVDLTVIDKSQTYITGLLRVAKTNLEHSATRVEVLTSVLDESEWVDLAGDAFKDIEMTTKRVKQRTQKRRFLVDLMSDVKRAKEKEFALCAVLEGVSGRIKVLDTAQEDLDALKSSRTTLSFRVSAIEHMMAEVDQRSKRSLELHAEFETHRGEECPICGNTL